MATDAYLDCAPPNPRYSALLESVANGAVDEKIRRYAELKIAPHIK